jgi:hypothetical protein
VLARGVVEDEVDAQSDPASVGLVRQRLEVA